MAQDISSAEFAAAIAAVESDAASAGEKAEMLMEIAVGMQSRPKSTGQLHRAVVLYERALELCPRESPLLRARITARMGTALQRLPDGSSDSLYRAQSCFETALSVLRDGGRPEEVAEVEMNLGLVLQSLAGAGQAKIQDAIQYYHRALRVFTREAYPQEFAILHNNIAIAYLSLPVTDERARMREALAVQSFEEVLKVINIVDHPSEYAMVQNNLGNALQYVSSSHVVENNLRALQAYDEALKVRNARDTPLEYANTLANKANVLRNLPDDPECPESGQRVNLLEATRMYEEAKKIFARFHQTDSAAALGEALDELAEAFRPYASANTNDAAGLV
ncbi:MAG: hypothetical protein HY028_03335 [Gammaproteobacteria bacterium]|nr:hypothetical protein [Gammaproteobacteria bacterium]